MSRAGWVASNVRGQDLLRRRLGSDAATSLSAERSLSNALGALLASPYRREVSAGMDLPAAQRAVWATVLWHLRILAGWGPPFGAGAVRALAGRFEIANVTGHLEQLAGRRAEPAFGLGALGTAWSAVSRTRSAAEVRRVLAGSPWGDPGAEEVASVRLALELAWARRVVDSAPGALGWATAWAAVVLGRAVVAGAELAPVPRRDVRLLVGSRAAQARDLAKLAAGLPSTTRWVLDAIDRPDTLWRSEVRWWHRVEADSERLVRSPRAGADAAVAVAGLLAVDAWRVGAALELAARGGRSLEGELDGAA